MRQVATVPIYYGDLQQWEEGIVMPNYLTKADAGTTSGNASVSGFQMTGCKVTSRWCEESGLTGWCGESGLASFVVNPAMKFSL